MRAKSLFLTLTFCLACLYVGFPAAAQGARLDVVVDHGVEKDAETQARAAVNATIDFFQQTYGLGLNRDLRIRFSCDKTNYKKAIKDLYGVSEAQASLQSKISLGLQMKGTLIVNLGEIHNNFLQLFVLCHEIVHHFQGQMSQDKHGTLRWMSEGMADAVAGHVLETLGVKGATQYRNWWQENLKKARGWPKLENLHTRGQWLAAIGAYGSLATYKTSAMAVMTLVQWKGYRPLFAYLNDLKHDKPEEAFYRAFGTRLSDFEKQFRPD
jgi:hypothetical protein